MKLKKRINIELLSKSLTKHIPVIQNDRGRIIECYITDCQIPTGTKVKFWAMKPSKKLVYNDCTLKDNVVSIELTNQTLAEKGSVACQLEFDGDVSSYEFFLDVERDISGNGVISENESTVLDVLLEEMKVAVANVKSETEKAKAATAEAKKATEEAIKATQESQNPIMEVTGSDITADQTHQGAAIIKELQGGTKQVTTQGRNLMNNITNDTNKIYVDATIEKDTYTIINKSDSISSTFRIFVIPKKTQELNGKTIVMSQFTAHAENDGHPSIFLFAVRVIDGEARHVRSIILLNPGQKYTFNSDDVYDDSQIYIAFALYTNNDGNSKKGQKVTYKNLYAYFEDAPLTEWEPFTGGAPSPSPDYPQEIKAIGMGIDNGFGVEVSCNGLNIIALDTTYVLTNATIIDKYKYTLKSNFENFYYSHIKTTDEKVLDFISKNKGNRINFKCDLLNGTNQLLELIIYGDRSNGSKFQGIEGETKASGLIATDFIDITGLEFRWNRKYSSFTDKESVYSNLMAWIGDDEPQFQPYKSSTAYIPLDSPLYEGDRIYLEDGELWEYREKKSLKHPYSGLPFTKESETDNYVAFYSSLTTLFDKNGKTGVFCNKLRLVDRLTSISGAREEGFAIDPTYGVLRISILKEKIGDKTIDEYLRENEMTFILKLATPTLKKLGSADAFNLRTFDDRTYIEVVGSKELGTENTFIVPRNQSGGLITDAFATSKRNEINAAGQANLESRISALEQLAVKESI